MAFILCDIYRHTSVSLVSLRDITSVLHSGEVPVISWYILSRGYYISPGCFSTCNGDLMNAAYATLCNLDTTN